MPDSQFIDTLSRVSWNQITDLFQFNQDTKAFYQNRERMNVIINELGRRGKSFTKEDSMGMKLSLRYYVLLFMWDILIMK